MNSITVLRSLRRGTICAGAFGLGLFGIAPLLSGAAWLETPAVAQPVRSTLPAAPADGVMGFVVSRFVPPIVPGKEACPDGPSPKLRDVYLAGLAPAERERLLLKENAKELERNWKLTAFGPDDTNICSQPDRFDRPLLSTVQSELAIGLDLDGGKGGCAHEEFISPSGDRGIDNQEYRALGCKLEWRSADGMPSDLSVGTQQFHVSGEWTQVILLRGVDSLENDDEVEVIYGNTPDRPYVDSKGRFLPGATFTISEKPPRHRNVLKGQITDGVLTTRPARIELTQTWGQGGARDIRGNRGIYDFHDGMLRLTFQPDGTVRGLVGGYRPLFDAILSPSLGGAGAAIVAGIDCAGELKTLRKYADGMRDPKTGQCTGISSAMQIDAVPAFVNDVRPPPDECCQVIGVQAVGRLALGAAAAIAIGCGLQAGKIDAAEPSAASTLVEPTEKIVALRRLTEAQYRNSIADIFGPDIEVAGRFEPIVRPVHELISSGASGAAISPAGLEQFDAMARNIAAQVFDANHRGQFVTCVPASETAVDPACAEKTLAPLGRFLFRRPLTAAETAFYVKLAGEAAAPTASFTKGLELALGTMLVSPNFLYIVESARPDPMHPGDLLLDDYSRAARLSTLLWNSTPNEALLTAAAQGRLSDDAELARFAERMTASPRFEDGVRAFFADMLVFERFDALAKDAIVYPYFNTDVAKAMPEQLLRTIVDQVLTRDGDYRDLFTTNRTFMNRPLASLYQVRAPAGSGWEPYEFPVSAGRSGLLGQAGFLALYSHSGRSSPTLRGRAVRELLLCQPVPDPPGNVNFTAVQDTTNTAMPTARIRLTTHATDPVCKGCHAITDPVGLSFEKFDGAGMFRTAENGAPIDDSGAMDGKDFFGVAGLGEAMAQNPSAGQCVASRALEYANGHAVDADASRVEALAERFAAQGYRIRALFRDVAASPDSYRIKAAPLDAGPVRVSLSK